MKNSKYLVLALAAVACAVVLGRAYTYKYRVQDTVVVTGLGETEFTSDLIVWSGALTAEAQNVAAGYAQIAASKKKVQDYLASKGVPAEAGVFEFVNVEKQYASVYQDGKWAGNRFSGYELRQRFTVESKEVEKVETVSREISSLIAQGVSIEAYAPNYYYTKLDDVKLGLIETASADARTRAEKIAANAGTKIGRVASARMGVFQ
ncbi:MAG: SIMPL domain-containing protein, partial [Alistipes sp.]|nr:SIMPL domain-containing protein [Alistipes sp.]